MKHAKTTIPTAAALLVALALPARANLLVNGDFETGATNGNPPPDSKNGVPASENLLPGWNFGSLIKLSLNTMDANPAIDNISVEVAPPPPDRIPIVSAQM